MAAKSRNAAASGKARSPAQHVGSDAMTYVMSAWGDLTDEEYLAWRVAASTRRTEGVRYFKQVNLRRVRRGDPVLRLPPQSRAYDPRPVLKRLILHNCDGRVTLTLELHRTPKERTTVWASRPYNRGAANPDKCPRLDWLPQRRGRRVDITRLYFEKHGPYIQQHSIDVVAKRICVRLRREVDEGASLYEEAKAVVPPPERVLKD